MAVAQKTLHALGLFLFLTATITQAQTASSAIGNSPVAAYDIGTYDNVNPLNGNLYLDIPLIGYPQLGSTLRLNFSIYYNAKQWFIVNFPFDPVHGQNQYPRWTWIGSFLPTDTSDVMGAYVARDQHLDIGVDYQNSYESQGSGYSQWTISNVNYSNFVREPTGAKHVVGDGEIRSCSAIGGGNCPTYVGSANESFPSTDSTGYVSASSFNLVIGPDGVSYSVDPNSQFETVSDLNGNSIQQTKDGWVDTVGRVIPGSFSGPGTATGIDQLSDLTSLVSREPIPGVPSDTAPCEGSAVGRLWQVPAIGGSLVNYYLCYTTVSFRTAFDLYESTQDARYKQLEEASGKATVLSQIILPTGQSYRFGYDEYMSLASLSVPSGASITYTWQTVVPSDQTPNIPVTRSLKTRTVDPGNGQPQQTTRYYFKHTSSTPEAFWSIVTDGNGDDVERLIGSAATPSQTAATYMATYTGCSPNDDAPDRTCNTAVSTLLRKEDYSYLPASTPRTPLFLTRTVTTLPTPQGPIVSQVVNTPAPAYGDCTLLELPTTTGSSQPIYRTWPSCFTTSLVGGLAVYDWGLGAPGPLLRNTLRTYKYATDSNYLAANLLSLPESVQVAAGVTNNGGAPPGTVLGQTLYGYDGPGSSMGVLGNLTSVTQGLGADEVTSTIQYNSQGMPIQKKDANGNGTQFTYQCSGSLPSSTINAINQTHQSTYDCSTGLLVADQDANDLATGRPGIQYSYDALRHLTMLTRSNGAVITYDFGGYQLPLTVTTTVVATPNPSIVSSTVYDGLGRLTQSVLPSGATAERRYDSRGNLGSVTNAHRGVSSVTDGTTWMTYDALGRLLTTTEQDGSARTQTYQGSTVLTLDEAGYTTSRATDALGELIEVGEPTGAITRYLYDVQSNLTSVSQSDPAGSLRSRAFTYNSISRLLTAQNPESGLACYGLWSGGSVGSGSCVGGYDGNGNLLMKTDARGQTVHLSYDALNRLHYKMLPDGTIEGFGYDGLDESGNRTKEPSMNSLGRLSHMSNEINAATTFSYDAVGEIVEQEQCIPADCSYSVRASSTYDLAGHLNHLTYPDGREVSQTWDAAGAPQKTGDNTNPESYIHSASYSPSGQLQQLVLGNGLVQTWEQNSRLQVSGSTVVDSMSGRSFLSQSYCYTANCAGGPSNTGNVWQITDNQVPARTQAFTYDSLGRLSSFAQGGVPSQSYSVDQFGNLSLQSNGQPTTTFDTMNRASNLPCSQFTTPFDAAGNQLCDSDKNGGTYQYTFDADNHLKSIALGDNTPFERYIYGADGARVAKMGADLSEIDYVRYNGDLISQRDASGNWTDYISVNGKAVARASSNVNELVMSGGHGASGCATNFIQSGLGGYQYRIRDGDTLRFEQKNASAAGGLLLIPFNAPNTYLTSGDTGGLWQPRAYDLSPLAGETINGFWPIINSAPSGSWTQALSHISISSSDGTITPIYWGQALSISVQESCGAPASLFASGPMKDPSSDGVTFVISDPHGSAQMEFGPAATPMWSTQLGPFGGEMTPHEIYGAALTDNTHLFTGKERDTESGLDNFGARYFGSNMGRFMSPDWSASGDPIPYADLTNPQTLNLYAYAGNNPLSNVDDDGHNYHICDAQGQNCSDVSDKDFDQIAKNARGAGESWSGGNIKLQDGSAGGSYKQTDVDLPGDPAANQAAANMIGNGGMGMIKEFVVQSTIGAVTEGVGQGIGLGLDALRAAQAAKAAEAAADASRAVKFGAGKSATKWANQLLKRGWTQSEIADAVANGERVPAVNNINPSNGATRYISPSSGKSVVVDNVTGEVIHVGGAGFKY